MPKESIFKEIKEATEDQLAAKILGRYGAETAIAIHAFLAGNDGNDIKPKIIAAVKKEHTKDRFLQTCIDKKLGLGDFAKQLVG